MDLVEIDRRGAVAHLTLNAPSSLNALSDAMLASLKARLEEIAASDAKVVILKGAGKAFCAGHDLKEMQLGRAGADQGRAYYADLFARCAEVMQMIPALPQPVIAQVHGIATAAGCQLVASCDMAVAAQGTRFGVNGINIGLFCSTPMVALTRNIPRKFAFEMLTTGGFIEADRARELGLINRIAAPENLAAETEALAETLAQKLTSAVKIGTRAFYDQLPLDLSAAYAHTAAVMVENMLWRDTDEGVQAFIEKRKPDWAE
jgi:enoyl-CoA hydratase/carnithine racemase